VTAARAPQSAMRLRLRCLMNCRRFMESPPVPTPSSKLRLSQEASLCVTAKSDWRALLCRRHRATSLTGRRPSESRLRYARLQQGFATSEIGFRAQFAQHHAPASNVRFGSITDIATPSINVRYSPESRHASARLGCPLSAKRRHSR
jgi:hypothetical protein